MSAVQNIRTKQDSSSLQPSKTESSVDKYRSMYRSNSNNRNNEAISTLPQIRNVNPGYGNPGHHVSHIGRLDSTTTSLQSVGGFTLNSQYRNIRTYSNLYSNPSKGFSLPTIAMKNSSIFYEKQRLGVGNNLNKIPFQPNSSLYISDLNRCISPSKPEYSTNINETVFEDPLGTERSQKNDQYYHNVKLVGSSTKQGVQASGTFSHQSPAETDSLKKIIPEPRSRAVIQKYMDNVDSSSNYLNNHEKSQNQDYLDIALGKAKTVSKTSYFHTNDNVMLIFRSMEVFCVKDDLDSKHHSKSSPIYIPVDLIAKLYRFNTKQLLKTLFDYIKFSKTGSITLDYAKLKSALGIMKDNDPNVKEFCAPESGVVRTSYMYQDIDYSVTIKYPYLEYHNNYKNIVVTRPLITEDDFKLFFKTAIMLTMDWPAFALK